jgi:photosystem II stability/assembly factor-like uncharacterized protein
MNTRILTAAILSVVLLASLWGCKEVVDPPTAVSNLPVISEDQATKSVSLTIGPLGGAIEFGDGTGLSIPANALTAETKISVTRVKSLPPMSQTGVDFIRLEPSGLNLKVPATLTLPFQTPSNADDRYLNAYVFSVPTQPDRPESGWEWLPISNRDSQNKRLQISARHFSWFTLFYDRPLDIVLEIPGKYLLKSDLLYGLTNGRWIPGHAALYLGSDQPSDLTNDGATIIESNIYGLVDMGVRIRKDFDGFITFGLNHIFMGARRYNGTLTQVDRTNIASYAISMNGRPYNLIGEGNGLGPGYSCVGLTEASYDHAGKSIIPPLLEIPFILPIEQYLRTVAVDEVTIRTGEEFLLPVKGVVWISGGSIEPKYDDAESRFTASATNLPSGASFGSNNVFRWTPAQTDAGKAYVVRFSVTAASQGSNFTSSLDFKINVVQGAAQPTLPPPPLLISPANGETAVSTNPTFNWNASKDATSYRLQVSTSSGFGSTAVNQSGLVTTSLQVAGLSNNVIYYWRVNATNSAGTGDWSSPIWHFTTASGVVIPETPTLLSPANGTTGVATNPTLTWNASSGAISYQLQVSTSSGFSSTMYDQSNLTTTSQQVTGLSNSVTYYWRVRASNSAGPSGWSTPVWNFTATSGVVAPQAPTLSSPANGTTGVAINPTLKWNASSGATSYQLQVSTSSGFSTTVYDQSNLTGTSQQVSGLANSATYYWRVKASNSQGPSGWSTPVWNFTTAPVNQGGWSVLPSFTSQTLNTAHFVSSSTGWIVGYGGEIWKTTSGGTSWLAQSSGTQFRLLDIQFLDSNTGLIVGGGDWGGHGIMLRTSNGGADWSPIATPAIGEVAGICFVSSTTGWAVSFLGGIIKSTNGGTSWVEQTSPVDSRLLKVSFANANMGWVSGADGVILNTSDGGTTWTQQNSGFSLWISDIAAIDSKTAVAVGEGGAILRTSDGGSTWAHVSSSTTSTLAFVQFTSTLVGYAFGYNGCVVKTMDGGKTWTKQTTPVSEILSGGYMLDGNIGWGVAEQGKVIKTTTGGN